ncbi:MAG: 50S ribosomal protein L11 [Halobacteriales archaeon]|nr:50S ribosomal protein L11 [Halobacteriales archaeon]
MAEQKIEVLVDGGNATPGPPLGPALGPMGVNVVNVVKMINEKTAAFKAMKVPVTVWIDPGTKEFRVTVGTPPTSALILKEIGKESGSGTPKQLKVGNISVAAAIKISKMKEQDLQGKNLKKRVKEVAGTALSMGVTVDGKDPREFQKAVDAGSYDGQIKE